MPEDNPALMTVEEAASYLRLAPWTLRHWVCQKKIPYVRLGRPSDSGERTWNGLSAKTSMAGPRTENPRGSHKDGAPRPVIRKRRFSRREKPGCRLIRS